MSCDQTGRLDRQLDLRITSLNINPVHCVNTRHAEYLHTSFKTPLVSLTFFSFTHLPHYLAFTPCSPSLIAYYLELCKRI